MKQGIDVSFAQAGFDFNAAVNNGKSFCIVKLGEHDYIDSAFADNINGALDVGMDAGVYFVPRSTDTDGIKQEAQFFADSIVNNGKSFCIVKLGEHDYIDSAFADNINGALDVGMDAGVYFVPRSTDTDGIKQEAQFFADSIKQNITAALNCGIWLDIEECY